MKQNFFIGKTSRNFLNLFIVLIILLVVTACVCNSNRDGNSNETSSTSETQPKNTDDRSRKFDASSGEVPSEPDLQNLVKMTLLDFNDAVQKGDFKDFYATIAEVWQKEISPEKFNQAFKSFIDSKANISEIKSMEAEFSPEPKVTKTRGTVFLQVEGSYSTSPKPTKFELEYVAENNEWKLSRIRVKTKSY